MLPTGNTSNKRCYAVKWSPSGAATPTTDWFNKYVVQDVIETDRTGGEPDQVTHYNYEGAAAWRDVQDLGAPEPATFGVAA